MLFFKISLQACAAEFESQEFYSVSTCTTAVHSFQNEQHFLCCLLPQAFTINSHLTKIFMCATVNAETILLDFFVCI